MKTVRFTQVVERSGRPHVHTLWVDPEKDPEFKRARDANRVMTVGKAGAGKTDLGVIGFDPEQARTGQLLLFPKSLKPFAGRRVVGIKFDLVEQPDAVAAPSAIPPPSRGFRRNVSARAAQAAGRGRAAAVANPGEPETATAPAERTAATRTRPARRERPPARRRGASAAPGQPRRSGAPEPRESADAAGGSPNSKPRASKLLDEVRRALKELEDGKAVPAYRRLERAVKEAESDS